MLRSTLAALAVLLAACGTPAQTAAPVPSSGEVDAVMVQGARGGRSAEVTYERPRLDAVPSDRQFIRTAGLGLELDEREMPDVRERAAEIVASVEGYVSAEDPRGMTLRIPDAQLEPALEALGALAKETYREIRTADVTDQYTDLEIRLANAHALRARLATLLEQAETVQEVLEVERELSRVTIEVEQLEGQLRALQDRVALSTVRLTLRERVRPGPVGYVVVGFYEGVKWLFVRD